ncbi:MAG: hypothetical protein A2096_15315 [Spirochaetes bacterium GWF1_41_5]|nr:MAG: hypothetical protein A2096_15315 [Spirochaetes bacterium GWF1_41_5]
MSKYIISKALKEVWAMKEAVYNDTKNLPADEVIKYFHEGTKKACKEMGVKLIKNLDGKSYRMVKS